MGQREEIVQIAKKEVGYKEIKNNQTKYGAWYGLQDEWCVMFVCWCANQAKIGTDTITKTASTNAMKNWFNDKNEWKTQESGYIPQAGDIIAMSMDGDRIADHTGLVAKYENGKIYTVEGNRGNAVGEFVYELKDRKIIGYSTPNYKYSNIRYNVHVQDLGWQGFKSADEIAGTVNEGKRIEAIIFEVPNDVEFKARGHVEGIGWQSFKEVGEIIGTTGEYKRLEAIEFECNREIEVQEHVQDLGWVPLMTAKSGTLGTTGRSLRLEAIKMKLV